MNAPAAAIMVVPEARPAAYVGNFCVEDVDVAADVGLGVNVAVGDDLLRIVEVVRPDGAAGIETKAVFVLARPETCTSPELVGEAAVTTVPVSVAAAAAVEVAAVVPGS